MCTSYGLDYGPCSEQDESFGIGPLNSHESGAVLERWAAEQRGTASVTGKYALNLNPVIANHSGGRRLGLGRWGLWRDGSGPAKLSSVNSRDDSLLRSWRKEFQHRALLPATWYIEGRESFSLPKGALFAIAAITSTVIDDTTGKEWLTYSMVTRRGIGEAASGDSIRGGARMPLVLPVEMHDNWLDPEQPGDRRLVIEAQQASNDISLAMTTSIQSEPVSDHMS